MPSNPYYPFEVNANHKIIFLLLFATILADSVIGFGYDSANGCTPNGKISRRGRAQMLSAIPCDLTEQAFCQLPGTAYPWHAVRRFVHENQGLMKRMYGDVRHISVLRDEIENNNIDIDDIENAAERYTRDGGGFRRAAKYMLHNRDEYAPYKVNNEALKEPHFRPVSSTTTTITTRTTERYTASLTSDTTSATITTTAPTIVENSENLATTTVSLEDDREKTSTVVNKNAEYTMAGDDTMQSIKNVSTEFHSESNNIELNSIYEQLMISPATDMHLGDNIQIIESPKLGLESNNMNNSEAVTISALRVVTTAKSVPSMRIPIRQLPTTQAKPLNLAILKSKKTNTSERIPSTEPSPPSTLKLLLSPTVVADGAAASVKGATAATTLKATTLTATAASSSAASHFLGNVHRNGTYNSNYLNNNKGNHSNNSRTESTTSAAASLVTVSASILPLKSNTDYISSSKLCKPVAPTPAPITTTVNYSSSTKPVLRDGQLFQDTMKQKTPPLVNMRGVNACPVKEEVVAPFWANNTRGEVLALLNLYPFEQYVHWEKCTHEHKQMYCRDGCRCEQQYRLHRLLAYDPYNECRGIFSDWFRFPSSCICKCYDIPLDFRSTSRSPRSESNFGESFTLKHSIDVAQDEVKRAIYEHATDQWYRPHDDIKLGEA